MQLKRVGYRSAIYFGAITLVVYLIMGILQLLMRPQIAEIPEYALLAVAITPQNVLIITPIIGAAVMYLFALLAICVYNFVAKKHPINWEVKK